MNDDPKVWQDEHGLWWAEAAGMTTHARTEEVALDNIEWLLREFDR